MQEDRTQGRFSFFLMSWEFRIRDWLRPPSGALVLAGVVPGMSILDFGCGPGGFSIAAARIVGPKGHVYALDVNPRALDAVRKAAEKAGLNNLSCVPAGEMGTFPACCVDVALLYDVLHDIPDPDPALAGLHRVIKPDGRLSVSDHHLDEARILAAIGRAGRFELVSKPVKPWNPYGFRAVKDA